MFEREVIAEGHIVDSGIMSEALDQIIRHKGRFRIKEFVMGRTNTEPSRARISFQAASQAELAVITDRLLDLGCFLASDLQVRLKSAPKHKTAPDDFYSTTNHHTEIRLAGKWARVANQRMDAVIVVRGQKAACVKLRDVKKGDAIVCGYGGIRVQPEFKPRDRAGFAFMNSEVSSEKKVELAVRSLAEELRKHRLKLVVVAGPVVVHTGGSDGLCKLVRKGHVSALLSGNALAVHDIEQALFGTSLGIDTRTGVPVREGHKNHMRAINAINRAGGIALAVRKRVLKSGIMYECVKHRVPFVLAGSLRDDGPLPETITDMNAAQEAYAKQLQGVDMVLMLPSWVKTICVDINPSVVTKLMDRGSAQALGVVTDVGLFLHLLAKRL